jgi:pimeloyl-ACP methyl ester carboxylesterase
MQPKEEAAVRKQISRLLVAAGVLVAGVVAVPGADAVPNADAVQAVHWQECPSYSDDVLRLLFGKNDSGKVARARELWARTECGTVSVPVDYADPGSPRITIALTRLKATGHRLGSLALNPGGPGDSGYLMPLRVMLWNSTDARLGEHYDLIGFDPRGVGYSTKVDCPQAPRVSRPLGPVSEEAARQAYDATTRANQDCSSSDPVFLRGLTTANVARDLDSVRAALHEPRLSYLGVSWGTWLGAVYRSLFPGRVDRMWLDSTAIPNPRLDAFEQGRAAASARDFARMAQWLAQHDDTYGFGTTAEEVTAALTRLQQSYDTSPRQFTDLPKPLDGAAVATGAMQLSADWPVGAQLLMELRDATGPEAPPTVKEVFGRSGGSGGEPPAGLPELNNDTMNRSAFCNEDTGPRDFASAWAAYRRRLVDFPVTGRASRFTPLCAGWTLPPQPVRLRHSGGSLVMSGHRHEFISPYEWTLRMREAIGGTVFTVEDDVHASVLDIEECGAHLVTYFETGSSAAGCQGEPGVGTSTISGRR